MDQDEINCEAESRAIRNVLPEAGDEVYRDETGWHGLRNWGEQNLLALRLERVYQIQLTTLTWSRT